MKRKDFRSNIIPTRLGNTDENQEEGNKEFDTLDSIYLESYQECVKARPDSYKRINSSTDHAKMTNCWTSSMFNTRKGKNACMAWLRSAWNGYWTYYIASGGGCSLSYTNYRPLGLCPALHYNLPSGISARSAKGLFKKKQINLKNTYGLDIEKVKDEHGKTIYHTLKLGGYPKTKQDEILSKELEELYNKGKVKEGLTAIGIWYSENGQNDYGEDFAGKHSPVFEYKGELYTRQISNPNSEETQYSDGTEAGPIGTVRWEKVEPISFIIKNWDEMPKSINPKGNEKAQYFDLVSEEAIISNIPFYPDSSDDNCSMWQNSMPRGFLNGIDVRNISNNGNPRYGATRGGNFSGECNFLNEAFNLARQPILEYEIPDSENEIPDDAFNGCIFLKKLILHECINTIGKRAFEGIDFKFAYKLKNGKLIFSQDVLENNEEIEESFRLNTISKPLVGFDYNILIQRDNLKDVIDLSTALNKNKFKIPYIFAQQLIMNNKSNEFCNNSDFRFFRSEIPDICDRLSEFEEEERLDFFKFAWNLGCFSTEKILNKDGKETSVILAQKASSLMAQLLKTNEMRLR